MNEQTELLLKELADKLGTSAEYILQLFINQAPISGTFFGIICSLILVGIVFSWIVMRKKEIEWKKRYSTQKIGEFWISYYVVILFVSLAVLIKSYDIVTAFNNPEFWAIKEIIYYVKQ